MTRLRLDAEQREQIVRAARAAYPRECCGLIEGYRSGETLRATAIHATRNASDMPNRFEIDPAEHIALLQAARAVGREILGCYHSHPNGRNEPSEHDRDNAAEVGFIWLIAALSDLAAPVSLQAFMFDGSEFGPVAFERSEV